MYTSGRHIFSNCGTNRINNVEYFQVNSLKMLRALRATRYSTVCDANSSTANRKTVLRFVGATPDLLGAVKRSSVFVSIISLWQKRRKEIIGCLETQYRRMWTVEQFDREFMAGSVSGSGLVLF